MSTTTPSLDNIVANLDAQISDKHAIVSGILDEIVQLKIRRERIVDTLREISGAVGAGASPSGLDSQRVSAPDGMNKAPIQGKASALIVEALRTAGELGLSGAELSKKVIDAGLSSAAADKAKTRLRQAGMVTQKGGRWYSPNSADATALSQSEEV
ncbi:hypothetical protein [Bradyrhizobium sp. LA2.1]|uniref:hypothetical protein n=1 Tax=Bradyrhizobium sp. LA2.1 TaxID=3156376 RepID=UPI003395BD14